MLTVDITSKDPLLSESAFRELTELSLSHLDALQGSFDRSHHKPEFHHQVSSSGDLQFWSVNAVVLISVGKERAKHLIPLYDAVIRLLTFELPDFEIRAQIDQFEFS